MKQDEPKPPNNPTLHQECLWVLNRYYNMKKKYYGIKWNESEDLRSISYPN